MSILRPIACLPFLLLPLAGLHAQTLQLSPSGGAQAIALALEACMADAQWEPEPSLACARETESQWALEVERLDARLDKVLGREARLALEASTAAWQSTRGADLALVEAYHDQLVMAQLGDPALIPLSRQLHRNAVLEERAGFLQRLLEGLETSRPPPPERHAPEGAVDQIAN